MDAQPDGDTPERQAAGEQAGGQASWQAGKLAGDGICRNASEKPRSASRGFGARRVIPALWPTTPAEG